jgi:DNA-directed RNA polymerase specialized sigma24 family protein
MGTSNLHLVDEHGQPLPSHITEAVKRMEPGIQSRFSKRCDPAELSNSLENAARRIAQHEQNHGPLQDVRLKGFTWRTLSNAALSLIRLRSREKLLSPDALESLSGVPHAVSSSDVIEQRAEVKLALARMSERDRKICSLQYQGFNAEAIGRELNISREAVWKAKSRRLSSLTDLKRTGKYRVSS